MKNSFFTWVGPGETFRQPHLGKTDFSRETDAVRIQIMGVQTNYVY